MAVPFEAPEFRKAAFNCPSCNAFAQQFWRPLSRENLGNGHSKNVLMCAATCFHCKKDSYWFEGKLIIPEASGVELPNPDMPEDCKADYMEARSIINWRMVSLSC